MHQVKAEPPQASGRQPRGSSGPSHMEEFREMA
jgi:hypothetical protein